MATIAELQQRLDNKVFDPAKLTPEQRDAVDVAFQSGQLKGYNSVDEIERERAIAARVIAGEKEKRDQPFTVATKGMIPGTKEGIERSDLELTGDIAGSAYFYIKDAPKIFDALKRDPKEGYGAQKLTAMGKSFDAFEKAAQRIPIIRNIKPLRKVARVLGRVVDDVKSIARAPTQLLQTEVKSQLGGMGGAGLGSLSYDIANLTTDFKGAALQDLSEVSDNDIKKLPYANQVLVHSAEAMHNALFFNLFGSSMAPILNVTLRGMKGVLGIGSKESKELAEAAQRKNIDLGVTTIAQADSIGGRLVSGFERVFGVIPLVNTFAKRQRKAVEKQTFEAFLDQVVNKTPLEHAAILNYQFLPAMKSNFENYYNMISDQYKLLDVISDSIGNPKFIPTKGVKTVAEDFMKRLEATLPPEMLQRTPDYNNVIEYGAAKMKASGFDDPLVDVVNRIRQIGDYMSPTEFQGIMRTLTGNEAITRMKLPRDLVFSLKAAAKEDFNKIADPNNIQGYMTSERFKGEYENLLKTSGKEAADEYAFKIQKGMQDYGKQLALANGHFFTTVSGFSSPAAQRLRNSSANIFSAKGLMGILPMGRISPDEIWEKSISTTFRNGSRDSINELRFLLGLNDPKNVVGKEVFNRARTRYFWDGFLKSFDKQPNLPFVGVEDRMARARSLGAIKYNDYEDIFEAAGTRVMEDPKRLDPGLAQKYGIGVENINDIKIKAGEAGEFNIKKFREAIGYTDEASKVASKNKWIAMYGGGEEGKKSADNLIKLIDILDKEYGRFISDSNAYLMRRIMLSGGGQTAIAGGLFAGAAASGSIVAALPLTILLATGGWALASPKSLKYLLDVYTDYERMAQKGIQANTNNAPKSLFRLLNWASEEDKDFPDVNPKKINFEEVTDYLLNKNILVPQLGFSPQAIAPKLRSQFYPELKTVLKSTEPELKGGLNYLDGSAKGQNQAETIVNYQATPVPSNIYGSTTGAPLPFQQYAPPQFQQGAQRQQQFQSLFPNDPLGAAIAGREQQ
jgi:hypothetical protein